MADRLDQRVRPIDPATSATAAMMTTLTDEQCFRRYLMPGNKEDLHDDVIDVCNALQNKQAVYPLVGSMYGKKALQVVYSKIVWDIKPYVPAGYKINTPALFGDFEKLLSADIRSCKMVVNGQQSNAFFTSCVNLMVDCCSRACDYKLGVEHHPED